jgi:hypothetical protein
MNKKKINIVMMCAVAVIISVSLPCLALAAGIVTDYQSYAQGDVVQITGFGWLQDEPVSFELFDYTDPLNPYLYYTFSKPAIADHDTGNFTDTQYVIQAADEGRTFLLVATGQSSGLAQTTFDDAAHLHFFEDAAQSIPRDAFAWGTTVYARADDLTTPPPTPRPCWQVRWINPSNNVVATHNLDASTLNTRNDSFVVPASGPSGIWKAELWRPDNNNICSSATFNPLTNPRYTLYFDVAQIVVIGADDSYITNHTPTFNSNSSLIFKYFLDVNNNPTDIEKTFLRFTIPSLPGVVASAKVRMRIAAPSILPSSRTYNINRVTGAWNVNLINYINQPLVAGAPSDSQPTPTWGLSAFNSLMRWDVTSDVMGFAQGSFANNGWRIVDSQAQDPEWIFYSTEVNTLTGSKFFGPVLLIDTNPFSVPTMTEWGMIIFLVLAGLGSVGFLRRQKKA